MGAWLAARNDIEEVLPGWSTRVGIGEFYPWEISLRCFHDGLQQNEEFSVAIVTRLATFRSLMKCDSCQEKATVFYTQVADGKLKKFVLCEACAEAQGITNPEGLLMAEDLLGSKGTPPQIPDLIAELAQQDCESCGFTLEDFRKVGRLGCPECYRVFSREIEQRLPSMHKGGTHKGYMPEGLMKQQVLQTKLKDLNVKLEEAVEEERFEDAAVLRDQLSELTKEEEGAIPS